MVLDRILFRSHVHSGEKLFYVVHQHWFAIYRSVVKIAFFGLLFPTVLWLMFPPGFWLFAIWFIFGFLRFFYEVIDWYFDALLITNHGIIDLDWRGFFEKSSTRIDYEAVAGVSYEKSGFWSSVFNFGLLVIEKESHGKNEISLPLAEDPQEAERQILLSREKHLGERGLEDGRMLKEILSSMVREHVRHEREKSKITDLL